MGKSVIVIYGVKEKWGKELRNRVGRWGRRALWKYIEKRKKSCENWEKNGLVVVKGVVERVGEKWGVGRV